MALIIFKVGFFGFRLFYLIQDKYFAKKCKKKFDVSYLKLLFYTNFNNIC